MKNEIAHWIGPDIAIPVIASILILLIVWC